MPKTKKRKAPSESSTNFLIGTKKKETMVIDGLWLKIKMESIDGKKFQQKIKQKKYPKKQQKKQ